MDDTKKECPNPKCWKETHEKIDKKVNKNFMMGLAVIMASIFIGVTTVVYSAYSSEREHERVELETTKNIVQSVNIKVEKILTQMKANQKNQDRLDETQQEVLKELKEINKALLYPGLP